MARPDLTGILLVGGASRRFGSAKALALWDGKSLAAHAWELLGETCGERVAVGKVGDELELPFPVLDDGTETRAAPTELCVVLPVDTPLITSELLLELADACAEAAVTQTGPLPAALRRRALPVLERRLADGSLALRGALAELDTCEIDADPALLVNVNTQAELQELARRTASASSSSSTSRRARPTR